MKQLSPSDVVLKNKTFFEDKKESLVLNSLVYITSITLKFFLAYSSAY